MRTNKFNTLQEACAFVGISSKIPNGARVGRWIPVPANGKPRTNTAGRILFFENGKGGLTWNWITGARAVFTEIRHV